MKQLAFAITGPSGSGKTTLIEKIVKELSKDYTIAVIKHDPSNKAQFDTEGKDSDRFFKAGANTAVVSDVKTTIFKHSSSTLNQLANNLAPFDLLLVEGLKNWELPRIGVFRGEIDKNYLGFIKAVAIDDSVKIEEDLNLDILNLNNIEQIVDYIWKNSIEFLQNS